MSEIRAPAGPHPLQTLGKDLFSDALLVSGGSRPSLASSYKAALLASISTLLSEGEGGCINASSAKDTCGGT